MSKDKPKNRDWMFTDFKPRHWLKLPEGVTYLIWQMEKCPTTGRVHHQCYVELAKQQRLTYLVKHVSCSANFEKRLGTPEQARLYCSSKTWKGKDKGWIAGPWELGKHRVFRKGQGLRTDLANFRDAIWKGKRKSELLDTDLFLIAKYPRLYNEIRLARMPRRTTELKTILALGKTGTGKSRWGFDKWAYGKRSYWRMPSNNGKIWFDGYDGHEISQIDDFCGKMSCCRLDVLLKIMDRYPELVPVKNSHSWWLPNILYITSNVHPCKWYSWKGREDMRDALKRRFTHVFDFDVKSAGEPRQIDVKKWKWKTEDDEFEFFQSNVSYGIRKKAYGQ